MSRQHKMNRFLGPSDDYLTHMTSPTSQDNLTPGCDVIVQNQEDDVYRNASSGGPNTSRGAQPAGVSAATRVTPQRDTQWSVFRAGSMATEILSSTRHKEVGKDEPMAPKRHIRSAVLIGRLALCFIRAPRNRVQIFAPLSCEPRGTTMGDTVLHLDFRKSSDRHAAILS